MRKMVLSVSSALELDQKSTDNKFVLIEENNTSDGSFVVSSFLEESVKKKDKILILLFHNSIGHYQSIAQKLGYNLSAHQDRGNVIVYDFLRSVMNGLGNDEDALKSLLLDVRLKISELQESNNVTLVIDNLCNLLLCNFQPKIVTLFIHYCLAMLDEWKSLRVICLTHNFSDNDNSSVLLNFLRRKADLNVTVDDLRTGKAVDVSGKMSVKWRNCDGSEWDEINEYHYQLLDKNVNVFAPGTKYL